MTYIKCDRCGKQINSIDNQSDVIVTANFDVHTTNFKSSIDLCETCTKQFYSHFMKNHWKNS